MFFLKIYSNPQFKEKIVQADDKKKNKYSESISPSLSVKSKNIKR